MLLLLLLGWAHRTGAAERIVSFEIDRFQVQGNTLLKKNELRMLLGTFTGKTKTISDVEAARDTLEKAYHEKGYPAVLVNIPEQTVEGGVVILDVVESTIRRVRVTGNRYFTRRYILERLPSLEPGGMLYLPEVDADLRRINRNPDLSVAPALMPGRNPGTIDVELKIEDHLPLHGSLELNNRSSHDTRDLRLNGTIRYDNLWQQGHAVSLQYQTTPEETAEIQVIAAAYTMATPWRSDHFLTGYAMWSDSEIGGQAFEDQFLTQGEGSVFGLMYNMPLPGVGGYGHSLSLGLTYKDFQETTLGFAEEEATEIRSPIDYLPASVSYSGFLPDSWGMTAVTLAGNMVFRGVLSDRSEFSEKQFGAEGSYLYLNLAGERRIDLPKGMRLYLNLDGQLSDQPLISNEQFIAGGMTSVRGYKEAEASGDDALRWSMELVSPDLTKEWPEGTDFGINVYGFYDGAFLKVKEPLPGQGDQSGLHGLGTGAKARWGDHFKLHVDWAVALSGSERTPNGGPGSETVDVRTEKGDHRLYFRTIYEF